MRLNRLTVSEAQQQFDTIIGQVTQGGEPVTIERDGRAIARIVPVVTDRAAAVRTLMEIRKRIARAPSSEIIDSIRHGRR